MDWFELQLLYRAMKCCSGLTLSIYGPIWLYIEIISLTIVWLFNIVEKKCDDHHVTLIGHFDRLTLTVAFIVKRSPEAVCCVTSSSLQTFANKHRSNSRGNQTVDLTLRVKGWRIAYLSYLLNTTATTSLSAKANMQIRTIRVRADDSWP